MIVEESVKSTVTVMDKVNAATEEVHRNNELAGQLEQGFDNVKDAVNKENAAVEEAEKHYNDLLKIQLALRTRRPVHC